MAAADVSPVAASDGAAASDGSIARTIKECVLAPIQGTQPAGEDVRNLKRWVELRTARAKAMSADPPAISEWESYGELVEDALCNQSKDLELGVFLTEARTRTNGFAGARDGFWMLRGLVEKFASEGLFPLVIDNDMETQYSPFYWLNEKFPAVLRELELTRRPEPPNYSWNYLIEANSPHGGMITKEQWDEAAMAGTLAAYDDLAGTIEEARTELNSLKEVLSGHYGAGLLSFSQTEETLESCKNVVESFIRRLRGSGGGEEIGSVEEGSSLLQKLADRDGESPEWGECERLARSGQVDQALSRMVPLAASEPNGRIRFKRKLLLADLCLKTNRKQLGTSILQELDEIIAKHKLDEWETTEIVGGVWARLVRCYRDKAAGTADEALASEFYNKLSRLDPWQALACGEPVRKD